LLQLSNLEQAGLCSWKAMWRPISKDTGDKNEH
jgi:hypothetical protein